jgi:succinate dehydrogenase hydrophobic anchor subunit
MKKWNFKPNQITAILIVFGGIFFVLYDMFAFYFFTPEDTISYVVNEWAWANPLGIFIAGCVLGGLTVHFLSWAPLEKQVNKNE